MAGEEGGRRLFAAGVPADALAAATNQSLDSWDQAPVATHLEQRLVAGLAARVGWDAGAGGVVTSGGTQSNLMGLLLARDAAAGRAGRDAAADGLGPDAGRWRVLCSELAHFSVGRAAALLGLGSRAVQPLGVDGERRLRPDELDRALDRMDAAGEVPVALVATAGTTDFGSIDPLPALAERAAAAGLWLHVDAAWGGGLLFSDRHRGLLEGIEAADSVAVDFHKLLWQPAGCGAFLVRDRARLAPIEVTVPYLNPDPPAGWPEEWRMPHLVGRSLATTRRFAALGPLLSFQAVGRRAHRRAGRPDPGAGRPCRRGRRGRARPGADRPPRARLGGVPLPAVARRPGALRPGQRGHPAAPAGHRPGGGRPDRGRRAGPPQAHPHEPHHHRRRGGRPGRPGRPDRRRP